MGYTRVWVCARTRPRRAIRAGCIARTSIGNAPSSATTQIPSWGASTRACYASSSCVSKTWPCRQNRHHHAGTCYGILSVNGSYLAHKRDNSKRITTNYIVDLPWPVLPWERAHVAGC